MEKSPELYVTILGILKAGGAWCPIDTLSPNTRRRDLITRTGAKMLLVARPAVQIDSEGVPSGVLIVDITAPELKGLTFRVFSTRTSLQTSDDIASLLWTSGTT